MAADEKWYFTKEQLGSTPSTRCGYDADRELTCRQQAAHLIQDMGQRLQVSQLCINTAMVYMHRFYVFHSFTQFHLDAMAAAALFLAAKVEEQPRKLEHVIRVKQICLHRDQAALDVKSEQYQEQAQDLVFNENVLLQTLGFDVAIDHPHTHVVRCCHLVRASKDLAQTSYFMASNSLHLTTMCLQYKPTVVACFCIHLACKWSNWEIPQSNEGKYWFYYVDKTVTQDLLEQLTDEFLVIFEKCPSRLKKKIKSANQSSAAYQFEKMSQSQRDNIHEGVSFQSHHRPQEPNKPSTSQLPQSSGQRPDTREYQEKRERERQMASQSSHSQHRDGHHRSHHSMGGHPHPPSAAAQLKPHAGGPPVHNKIPHPGQHRSSASHHLRAEHHNRPDHPQRPDHQHQQRQDRQPRPDHPVRTDHHPRGDHTLRPDQARPDHHQVRPDHQQRVDHPRSDHHNRPDHQNRPEHQGRPSDHQLRPDHPSSHQRIEPSGRIDQGNRQEHSSRSEYPSVVAERHDRLDGHIDQRHSSVTAARDQLRRDAALQREAAQRESSHCRSAMQSLAASLTNHSPAQRTTSGDSAISLSSSTSLTPSCQDWSGFGSTSTASVAPPPMPPKHSGPETSHRHPAGYEKPKSVNSSLDSYSRHRSNLPVTDRRQGNAGVSLDKKMMLEISERRQLESFFGKTEAMERINEKHQVKLLSSAPFKEVKKEPETVQLQPLQTTMPATVHVKREKVSPSKLGASLGRHDLDMTAPLAPSLAVRQNSFKPSLNDHPIKSIKTEPDAESFSDSRNGTPLLIPKVEKIETNIKGESLIMPSRLPPVKSSIFSPEKVLPKERESPMLHRAVKTNYPPSPGIAFGSPPVTPGKSQGSSNRIRTASSCESESAVELFRIEKDPGLTNVVRDGRNEMRNPHMSESLAQMSNMRNMEPRLPSLIPKVEPKLPPYLLNKTNHPNNDHRGMPLYPPASIQGRNNINAPDERLALAPPQVSTVQDARVSAKSTDIRTGMPLVPIEGDLGAVAFPASDTMDLVPAPPSDEGSSAADHHHHKSKKKKEKKEKHKHKDKDKEKHREEKKHKSKHKEKDKERRKAEALSSEGSLLPMPAKPESLKIKIPKANITPPPAPAVAAPSGGGLKLKISLSSLSSAPSASRKRDRDKSSPEPPHAKAPKMSYVVDTPKHSNADVGGHGVPSKGGYARQNGLESRGGGKHHMQHLQHYSGSKMVLEDGSTLKPPEISKNSSSHSSTS